MYQQITIVGNVGRDAEQRYLPDGKPVTTFSVAASEKWKDANGQAQERTVWFKITAWQQLAEICGQYVKKGMKVLVVGTLTEPKPYQDRQGEWRASLDVRANVVRFLSRVEGEAIANEAGPAPRDNGAVADIGEDQIPF
jgi:single-strand DNA-binding protein